MLSVPLSASIEQRLADMAKSRGQSEADVARDLIEAGIDDLDDLEMAGRRLENRRPALTSVQAWDALGLDD